MRSCFVGGKPERVWTTDSWNRFYNKNSLSSTTTRERKMIQGINAAGSKVFFVKGARASKQATGWMQQQQQQQQRELKMTMLFAVPAVGCRERCVAAWHGFARRKGAASLKCEGHTEY